MKANMWNIFIIVWMFWSAAFSSDISIRQITFDNDSHLLGPYNPWSPDDEWIVYTCGPNHLNDVVKRTHVKSGRNEVLFAITNQTEFGPGCGTASYGENGSVIFIYGPHNASAERKYEFWRRSAMIVNKTGTAFIPDARDIIAPFSAGALRGGTHCHQFSKDGQRIAFTYNDMLVSPDLRTVGVSVAGRQITVDEHPENHNGKWFSLLLVPVKENPVPGSGELSRAYENCWVEWPDGRRAIAFKGNHIATDGTSVTDIFLVDVPEKIEPQNSGRPLAGTETELPFPPAGAAVRELTDFSKPGLLKITARPRFWLSSTPDGSAVFFQAEDTAGINQIYSVKTGSGEVSQITAHEADVFGTVSVHASGKKIAYLCDGSVFVTYLSAGGSERLTAKEEYNPAFVYWSHGDQLVFGNRSAAGAPVQLFMIDLFPPATVIPRSRFDKSGWGARHETILKEIENKPELIFVGDSITERWYSAGKTVWDRYYKPLNAANLGVGGDGTQHVLWRLKNGELDRISPKAAVVMIGTNNSNGDTHTAEEIADGIIAVVSELRARIPETKILLLSIFPRGTFAQREQLPAPAEYNDQRRKNEEASRIAAEMADGKHVFYLDINSELVDRKNRVTPEIMPDLVHLSSAGYEIWAKAMNPVLGKLMGTKRLP
ncbi:MAG: DUF3748 domain-containing protein [Kiritimatiellales bacterium]